MARNKSKLLRRDTDLDSSIRRQPPCNKHALQDPAFLEGGTPDSPTFPGLKPYMREVGVQMQLQQLGKSVNGSQGFANSIAIESPRSKNEAGTSRNHEGDCGSVEEYRSNAGARHARED